MAPDRQIDVDDAIEQIRELYNTGSFQQIPLISKSSFRNTLARRRIRLLMSDFDEFSDLLRPISQGRIGEALYHPYQIWIADRVHSIRPASWRCPA